jgi:hypothetical protein
MKIQCILYKNQFPFVNYIKHKALTNGGNLSWIDFLFVFFFWGIQFISIYLFDGRKE